MHIDTMHQTKLQITGALNIHTAEHWCGCLRDRTESGLPLVVDLTEVTEADTNGLQLLLSARRTAVARGLPFALHNPTAQFRQACTAAAISLDVQLSSLS